MNYQEIVEWDVSTWSRALNYWDDLTKDVKKGGLGLEIGARNGGLTLFFARKLEANIYCTDFRGPTEKALKLHRDRGIDKSLEYFDVDATKMPFDNDQFDFVYFKSVLGAIGGNNGFHKQQNAVNEIFRVLKPGGMLYFAENLKATQLHQLGRKLFIPWAAEWRYLSLEEIKILLGNFSRVEIKTTGFFSAFVPKPEYLKTSIAKMDQYLAFIPDNWKYVAYGHAVK